LIIILNSSMFNNCNLIIGVATSGGALVIYEREAREPLVVKLFSIDTAPLLGSSVAYCSAKDSFLILSPNWEIQTHK
jgi:hypothetical protein